MWAYSFASGSGRKFPAVNKKLPSTSKTLLASLFPEPLIVKLLKLFPATEVISWAAPSFLSKFINPVVGVNDP